MKQTTCAVKTNGRNVNARFDSLTIIGAQYFKFMDLLQLGNYFIYNDSNMGAAGSLGVEWYVKGATRSASNGIEYYTGNEWKLLNS